MGTQTLIASVQTEGILPSQHKTEESVQLCFICREELGLPRADGEVEKLYMLPCSHTFGHICIERWLASSPNHNCPTCRRSMIYDCGHPIKAVEISTAPKSTGAYEMLEKCLLCRQEGVWKQRLAMMEEKQQAEERVLEGLKSFLPTLYGGMCVASTVQSAAGRIEESRERLRQDVECLRAELEKEENMISW